MTHTRRTKGSMRKNKPKNVHRTFHLRHHAMQRIHRTKHIRLWSYIFHVVLINVNIYLQGIHLHPYAQIRKISFILYLLVLINSINWECNTFPFLCKAINFHKFTVLKISKERWPIYKTACHRLNTTTKACTIVEMDTMFEYRVCYATNSSGKSSDLVNRARKQHHYTCIWVRKKEKNVEKYIMNSSLQRIIVIIIWTKLFCQILLW